MNISRLEKSLYFELVQLYLIRKDSKLLSKVVNMDFDRTTLHDMLNMTEEQLGDIVKQQIMYLLLSNTSFKKAVCLTKMFHTALVRHCKGVTHTADARIASYLNNLTDGWNVPVGTPGKTDLNLFGWVFNDVTRNYNGGNIIVDDVEDPTLLQIPEKVKYNLNDFIDIATLLDQRCGVVENTRHKTLISCILGYERGDYDFIKDKPSDKLCSSIKRPLVVHEIDKPINGIPNRNVAFIYKIEGTSTPTEQDKNLKKQNYLRLVGDILSYNGNSLFQLVNMVIDNSVESSYFKHLKSNSNSNSPIIKKSELIKLPASIRSKLTMLPNILYIVLREDGLFIPTNRAMLEVIKCCTLNIEYYRIKAKLDSENKTFKNLISLYDENMANTPRINFKPQTLEELLHSYHMIKDSTPKRSRNIPIKLNDTVDLKQFENIKLIIDGIVNDSFESIVKLDSKMKNFMSAEAFKLFNEELQYCFYKVTNMRLSDRLNDLNIQIQDYEHLVEVIMNPEYENYTATLYLALEEIIRNIRMQLQEFTKVANLLEANQEGAYLRKLLKYFSIDVEYIFDISYSLESEVDNSELQAIEEAVKSSKAYKIYFSIKNLFGNTIPPHMIQNSDGLLRDSNENLSVHFLNPNTAIVKVFGEDFKLTKNTLSDESWVADV